MPCMDKPRLCGGSEAMYQNSVWNRENSFLTQLTLPTYLTEYTKGKVGTKLSSDHSPCGYAQAIS